jgi:hypothetical protein
MYFECFGSLPVLKLQIEVSFLKFDKSENGIFLCLISKLYHTRVESDPGYGNQN